MSSAADAKPSPFAVQRSREQVAVGNVLRLPALPDELLHSEIDAAPAKERRLHLRDDRLEIRLPVKGPRVELLGGGSEHGRQGLKQLPLNTVPTEHEQQMVAFKNPSQFAC